MTPDRWRQLTTIFHAAQAREADERSAYLDRACGADASLRAEVEGLLAANGNTSGLGETPDADVLPQLSPGTTFGQYRVEALIGAGGMGQVYRATDTRLHRTVALKVLMPDLALDPGFIARFEREARLLAALNHANIAAIHGVEETDGVSALVLEFVEGPTLAERLVAGRPLPGPEALSIARQIALALEAAHEKGIVHRDLKPTNIKITPAGLVKVLDFGIARVASDEKHLALTASATRPGAVLGTAAYMSPEQARGLAVDKRTDVWAFGCVLFEMLTGRGAFAAETASDSLVKVIERDPEWSALPASVPESIRRLLRRCLQKNPTDRLHDIADARIEVTEAQAPPEQRNEMVGRSGTRPWSGWAALAIAALAVLAAVLWFRPFLQTSSGPASGQAMEFGVPFPSNFMPTDGVAISPDGRKIAANVWSGSGNIWMHSLDGSPPQPLPGGELARLPFWSPDSSKIGFFQGGQIVTMTATGGPVTRVAKIEPGVAGAGGGSWNRDDVILFSAAGKLYRVSASGGSAPVEVAVSSVTGDLLGPTFLPDGRHFVFCADAPSGGFVHLSSLDDGRVQNLGESECPGGFAPPDRVLFVRGGSLLAQKLDLRLFTLDGQPQVVAANVTRGAVGPWPALTVSASDTGALAFPAPRGGSSLGKLTWFDRAGKIIGTIEPPSDEVEYLNPAISPTDSNLIAANRLDPQTGVWHVWLIDGSRGNAASRLTTDAASDSDPAWSPDGREIVYASDRGGRRAFYRQPIAGGPPTEVLDVSQFKFPTPTDWSKGGQILFQELQRSSWGFLVGDRAPTKLAQPFSYDPHLSPDGKWLAYGAASGGQFELFVERFPGGSPQKQISSGGGTHPRWTNAGELVYWAPPGGILSTELSLSDQEIRVGQTRTLVAQPVLNLIDARTHFDITRDGRKILARQPAGPPSPGIRVIVNWMAKVK